MSGRPLTTGSPVAKNAEYSSRESRRKRRVARKGGTSKYGKAVTGGKHHTVWNTREKALEAIKRNCHPPKCNPYAVANKGKSFAGRSDMAKKAAKTRGGRRAKGALK
jgi:hypothetical protein